MASETIKAQLLTTYEVTAGGSSCRINFVDTEGAAKTVEFPVWCLQQLTLTVPKILLETSKALCGNISIRLNHDVSSWDVTRSPDQSASVVMTFTTPDGYAIAFRVPEAELVALADCLVEYQLEAFPEGLGFQHR